MKQRFFLPFLLTLAALAVACGGSTEVATDVEPSAQAEEVEEVEETVEAEETTTTTEAAAEPEAPAATGPVVGQDVYEANCARCHGDEGQGGRGANLQGIAAEQPDTMAAIAQTVNGGNGMPAFGQSLSPEEIEASVDYIFATFLAAEPEPAE